MSHGTDFNITKKVNLPARLSYNAFISDVFGMIQNQIICKCFKNCKNQNHFI